MIKASLFEGTEILQLFVYLVPHAKSGKARISRKLGRFGKVGIRDLGDLS
jgi:hypothetical protein